MLPEENILFRGIDIHDCRRMVQCFNAEFKKYKSGSRISDTSLLTDYVGIVLSGRVIAVRYDINGNRAILEAFGERGVFGSICTAASAVRSGMGLIWENDCEIMFVRYSELTKRCENACRCHSQVVENMLELMSEKTVALSERVGVLSQRSIEGKLLSCLEIIEDKTTDGEVPQIPFSTTALSDYLCVNRSALQREITKLKNKGILKIDKRSFRLVRSGI